MKIFVKFKFSWQHCKPVILFVSNLSFPMIAEDKYLCTTQSMIDNYAKDYIYTNFHKYAYTWTRKLIKNWKPSTLVPHFLTMLPLFSSTWWKHFLNTSWKCVGWEVEGFSFCCMSYNGAIRGILKRIVSRELQWGGQNGVFLRFHVKCKAA